MNTDIEEIERLIDSHGMVHFLELVEEVCQGKAEHIRANWQDYIEASRWERMAKEIRHAAFVASRERMGI